MSTPNIDPPTQPGNSLEAQTVQSGSADTTVAGPVVAKPELPAVPLPPPPTPPPPAIPPPSSPRSGGDYSLAILIGVFVLALVGIGLLGLGIYAVVKLTSNSGVPVAASTPTLAPLANPVVLVPTTTPAPSATATATTEPSATAAPVTATTAVTAAATDSLTATVSLAATASLTATQSGNQLTIVQGANVRSGPGINYPVVGNIKAGDTAPVVGRDAFGAWFVISFKGGFGGQGWISSQSSISAYNGDKSKLPVVAAPPPPAPTATPKPAGNPSGGLVTGAHGVSGNLNLCSSKVTFAVNERVCFVEWIKNNTAQPVPYGVLGVTAVKDGGGAQFQTSWSGQLALHGELWIDPGCVGPTDRCKGQWEDGMRLGSPGNYQLFLNVCFSGYSVCRGTSGDWEVLSGAIVITVQ